MSDHAIITLTELAAHDLTAADVRERCPWATEYTGLDGQPFWFREDLGPLLGDAEGRSAS
jgi:hypothetical protein